MVALSNGVESEQPASRRGGSERRKLVGERPAQHNVRTSSILARDPLDAPRADQAVPGTRTFLAFTLDTSPHTPGTAPAGLIASTTLPGCVSSRLHRAKTTILPPECVDFSYLRSAHACQERSSDVAVLP